MGKKRKAVERHKGDFAAFDKTDGPEAVAAMFEQRYHYRPEAVHDGGTVWLAGPKRSNGTGRRSLVARAERAQRPMTPDRARQLVMEFGGVA